MKLSDTVGDMLSLDYDDRLRGEYAQLKIRLEKIHDFVVMYESKTLVEYPDTPLSYFKKQEKAMRDYMFCLEIRAAIEGVSLDFPEEEGENAADIA